MIAAFFETQNMWNEMGGFLAGLLMDCLRIPPGFVWLSAVYSSVRKLRDFTSTALAARLKMVNNTPLDTSTSNADSNLLAATCMLHGFPLSHCLSMFFLSLGFGSNRCWLHHWPLKVNPQIREKNLSGV